MDSEPRPYFSSLTKKLDGIVDESWNDPAKLLDVAYELLFRERRAAIDLRDRVVNRLGEIYRDRGAFLWPSTEAPEGSVPLDQGVFKHDTSPLGAMGYRVGMKGPADADRQAILERAYMGNVPPVNSAEYMNRWSSPQSANRLQRMAELIATNVRNRKRNQSPGLDLAIAEWERDLAYLKRAFYDGRYDGSCGFPWPDTALS